jgi:hypothetical protein
MEFPIARNPGEKGIDGLLGPIVGFQITAVLVVIECATTIIVTDRIASVGLLP